MVSSYNLDDLKNGNPEIKYGMQKKILKLAGSDPQEVYQDFDYFTKLLNDKNNIMVWTGTLVLGYLSKVDRAKKIDKILPQIIAKLNAGKMITAANAIKSLTEIAKNRPDLADQIIQEILKVKNFQYDSEECNHIAIGHALKNVKPIFNSLPDHLQEAIIKFAEREINNPRPATAKKAKDLLMITGGCNGLSKANQK